MGEIDIRTFENPDDKILGKIASSMLAFIEGKLNAKKKSYAAVAYKDGEFAGGVAFWHYGPDARIAQLFVEEKFRGQGIGKKLVDAVERTAIQKQCRQVTVDTATFEAPDFYHHIGYECLGTIKGIFTGHDRVTFRKILPG